MHDLKCGDKHDIAPTVAVIAPRTGVSQLRRPSVIRYVQIRRLGIISTNDAVNKGHVQLIDSSFSLQSVR